ncbi:hypothetical protein D3C80_1573950 [compost metagenome]
MFEQRSKQQAWSLVRPFRPDQEHVGHFVGLVILTSPRNERQRANDNFLPIDVSIDRLFLQGGGHVSIALFVDTASLAADL